MKTKLNAFAYNFTFASLIVAVFTLIVWIVAKAIIE